MFVGCTSFDPDTHNSPVYNLILNCFFINWKIYKSVEIVYSLTEPSGNLESPLVVCLLTRKFHRIS